MSKQNKSNFEKNSHHPTWRPDCSCVTLRLHEQNLFSWFDRWKEERWVRLTPVKEGLYSSFENMYIIHNYFIKFLAPLFSLWYIKYYELVFHCLCVDFLLFFQFDIVSGLKHFIIPHKFVLVKFLKGKFIQGSSLAKNYFATFLCFLNVARKVGTFSFYWKAKLKKENQICFAYKAQPI